MPKCISILSLVFALALVAAPHEGLARDFHPESQRPISSTGGEWKVTLVGRQPCVGVCAWSQEYVFDVEQIGTGVKRKLIVATGMEQVNAIYVTPWNRAIILGNVNGDVSQVVVANLATASLVRSWLCYSPVVSADLKYVAFVYFFPPHGTPTYLTSYVYGVADIQNLSASPNQYSVAGLPVYPDENRRAGVTKSLVTKESSNVHSLASRIKWTGDVVTFIDDLGGARRKVTVDLRAGLSSVRVSSAGI